MLDKLAEWSKRCIEESSMRTLLLIALISITACQIAMNEDTAVIKGFPDLNSTAERNTTILNELYRMNGHTTVPSIVGVGVACRSKVPESLLRPQILCIR